MTLDRIKPKLLCGSEGLGPSDNGPSRELAQVLAVVGFQPSRQHNRGVLAEFLVAHVLGIDGIPRREWEPYDLQDTCLGRYQPDKSVQFSVARSVQSSVAIDTRWLAPQKEWTGGPVGRAASLGAKRRVPLRGMGRFRLGKR